MAALAAGGGEGARDAYQALGIFFLLSFSSTNNSIYI